MNYTIQIYTKQTMLAEMEAETEDFFDNDKNLIPFTEKQLSLLKTRLLDANYEIIKQDKRGISFRNLDNENLKAILTKAGLYLRATYDDAFEIGILASELADSDEFAKYDPQADGWETLDFE